MILPLYVNVDTLQNAKEELILLKFVIAVKLDCELTIEVFIKLISDVLYKLHCEIILKLTKLTGLKETAP